MIWPKCGHKLATTCDFVTFPERSFLATFLWIVSLFCKRFEHFRNACSSCRGQAGRPTHSYIIAPGVLSGDIHIIDVKSDPKAWNNSKETSQIKLKGWYEMNYVFFISNSVKVLHLPQRRFICLLSFKHSFFCVCVLSNFPVKAFRKMWGAQAP